MCSDGWLSHSAGIVRTIRARSGSSSHERKGRSEEAVHKCGYKGSEKDTKRTCQGEETQLIDQDFEPWSKHVKKEEIIIK